ncbi:MAG: diguanylate cyclase [Solirubrobacteraceae bacterium]|nr:diguanylate cyclase [Solirubrobacteraceae bacterium]
MEDMPTEEQRAERARTTAERTQLAAVRTATTQRQFQVAEQRDRAASARDVTSEARDRAASERDGMATGNDTGAGPRKRAADDREHSADDRQHAAGDRWETRLDRDHMRDALSEAHIDDVTGTLGRSLGDAALSSELERAVECGQPLVLAFVAVSSSGFGRDRGGDPKSDEILLDVVKSLRLHLRSYDPVVRFDGNTFVCALTDTDLARARERFAAVEASLAQEPQDASITVGFVEHELGDTVESMVERGIAVLDRVWRPSPR